MKGGWEEEKEGREMRKEREGETRREKSNRKANKKQEQAKDKFRYIMYGTIDNPEGLDPKGEFFCRYREKWMPEIPGKSR